MTAVVRPDGVVQDVLPPFARDALVTEVQGYVGSTPTSAGAIFDPRACPDPDRYDRVCPQAPAKTSKISPLKSPETRSMPLPSRK